MLYPGLRCSHFSQRFTATLLQWYHLQLAGHKKHPANLPAAFLTSQVVAMFYVQTQKDISILRRFCEWAKRVQVALRHFLWVGKKVFLLLQYGQGSCLVILLLYQATVYLSRMKRMNANKDIAIPLINKHLLDLHRLTFWQWGEFMIMDQNISGDICIIWSFRSFFDHKTMEDAEELGWGWMTGSDAKCWYIQWQCKYHLFCSGVCNRNNTVHNFKCSGDITKCLWIVSHSILVSIFWKSLNWITKKLSLLLHPIT